MKNLLLLAGLCLMTATASATVGTYTGELEKEGPEAEFLIGFASDKSSKVQLEVGEFEGLEIKYNQSFRFDPGNVSKTMQYGGNRLPVKEFNLYVESVEPSKKVYSIPVVFKAFKSGESSEGTSPRVVHEREYVFNYRTELSSNYGFEGDLIRPEKDNISDSERDQDFVNGSEENSLTGENQTSSQGEQKAESSENWSTTTYALLTAVVLVFSYIMKEVLI